MNRKINFFKTDQGDSPVASFLDQLSGKQAQKMVWVMQLFEELPVLPKQYFKHIAGSSGIWEFRAQQGGNIFRVLGFFGSDDEFIATNGFQKKTQKTPRPEIELAERRKRAYLVEKMI